MDKIFTYRGQNVDEMTGDDLLVALKQCIRELEQERRYKHPLPGNVFPVMSSGPDAKPQGDYHTKT